MVKHREYPGLRPWSTGNVGPKRRVAACRRGSKAPPFIRTLRDPAAKQKEAPPSPYPLQWREIICKLTLAHAPNTLQPFTANSKVSKPKWKTEKWSVVSNKGLRVRSDHSSITLQCVSQQCKGSVGLGSFRAGGPGRPPRGDAPLCSGKLQP